MSVALKRTTTASTGTAWGSTITELTIARGGGCICPTADGKAIAVYVNADTGALERRLYNGSLSDLVLGVVSWGDATVVRAAGPGVQGTISLINGVLYMPIAYFDGSNLVAELWHDTSGTGQSFNKKCTFSSHLNSTGAISSGQFRGGRMTNILTLANGKWVILLPFVDYDGVLNTDSLIAYYSSDQGATWTAGAKHPTHGIFSMYGVNGGATLLPLSDSSFCVAYISNPERHYLYTWTNSGAAVSFIDWTANWGGGTYAPTNPEFFLDANGELFLADSGTIYKYIGALPYTAALLTTSVSWETVAAITDNFGIYSLFTATATPERVYLSFVGVSINKLCLVVSGLAYASKRVRNTRKKGTSLLRVREGAYKTVGGFWKRVIL